MLRLSLSLVCLALLLASPAARCADIDLLVPELPAEYHPAWVHVPASDSNMDFYIDRNSVVARDQEIEYWDVVVFRQANQIDEASDRRIKEKRTLRRVHCEHQDQVLLKGASFDEAGRLIESITLPPAGSARTPVRSGTVASSELLRVCRQLNRDVPLQPVPRPPGE